MLSVLSVSQRVILSRKEGKGVGVHCRAPPTSVQGPGPSLSRAPASQICSNLFNLELTVQFPPPPTHLNLFTMKHGLSESEPLEFN